MRHHDTSRGPINPLSARAPTAVEAQVRLKQSRSLCLVGTSQRLSGRRTTLASWQDPSEADPVQGLVAATGLALACLQEARARKQQLVGQPAAAK